VNTRNLPVWSRLYEVCGQSLADNLWRAVICKIAEIKLFKENRYLVDEEESEEQIELLLASWLHESLRTVNTSLIHKIGEYDFFQNISEPWYEILGFSGPACSWHTSDIIDSLELAYPTLEGKISAEEIERFYGDWVAKFLARVCDEAASIEE
jgi:hypothetical protein